VVFTSVRQKGIGENIGTQGGRSKEFREGRRIMRIVIVHSLQILSKGGNGLDIWHGWMRRIFPTKLC
jgi:hypothetical protein